MKLHTFIIIILWDTYCGIHVCQPEHRRGSISLIPNSRERCRSWNVSCFVTSTRQTLSILTKLNMSATRLSDPISAGNFAAVTVDLAVVMSILCCAPTDVAIESST